VKRGLREERAVRRGLREERAVKRGMCGGGDHPADARIARVTQSGSVV